MRVSFICIVLCSIGIIGPACVGGIRVLPRQDVKAPGPAESTSTTKVPASSSDTVAATNSASGTQSIHPTATSKSGNGTTSTENPRPSDFSFLNGTEPDPNILPLKPKITPGLSIAGVVLIIAGGIYALVGVRNKWLRSLPLLLAFAKSLIVLYKRIQIFFSVGFLSALAVTILIIYLMKPPVSDAVQGAFFVAAFITGSIFGGISLAFQEVSEGFGCMLGGFTLSMWILAMKPGGLFVETSHKAAFISSLTVGLYCFSFTHHTRPYALICSTSFSGATVAILGIDCFSKAGLKEFWIYIWGLNEKEFPFNTKTYPITRGIRAELAGIVVIFIMGLISQAKLWTVIRDRRRREAALREEEQKKRDQIEEEIGRNLEEGMTRERAQWEAVYGDHPRPPNDSGIEIGQAEDHERHSGTPDERRPAGQGQTYEMDALRSPHGDDTNGIPHRSRQLIQPLVAAGGMPAQTDTPLPNDLSAGDSQDSNLNLAAGRCQPGLHELPADTELLVSPDISMNSVRANPFQVTADDECSSVAASLAESDYMAGVHSVLHPNHVEGGFRDDDDDGFNFDHDTRSISSSVEVEHNEEHDYNLEQASPMESGSQRSPSSVYSEFQAPADPTPITEPDSSDLDNANDVEGYVKNRGPAPIIKIGQAASKPFGQTPSLSDSKRKGDENDRRSVCESERTRVVDGPSRGSEISGRKEPDQVSELAEPEESISNRASAFTGLAGGSISDHIKSLQKQDEPTGLRESHSSSIPVPKRLSRRQLAVASRAKLTAESVVNIPSHTSKVVLTHRTNEWAKHISDAEPPEVKEIDDPQQDTETDEPAVPVLVSELQQTAASTLNCQEPHTNNSSSHTSHNEEDPESVLSSPRKSYTSAPTVSNVSASSPVKPSNSTSGAQTPPIHPLHRSASNSPISAPRQSETNQTRPSSSVLSTYKSVSNNPETNDADGRTPQTRELRMPAAPLIAQRESAIHNRSLLLPTNIPSSREYRLSRSASQLSLNLPPKATRRSLSPYLTQGHAPIAESAEDLPLSARRELIRRDMHTQNQAQTHPGQKRPASVCSFPSLENMSLVTARRQYQAQQQAQDPLQVRETKLARWRESVREENTIKTLPDAVVETRRANLLKEHQRSQLGKHKRALRASYRESVINQAMGKGDMQYMHTEALKKMQAAANKHV
ncbi:hypothetical protein ACJ72_03254 [Emergomyces africanus]|uniref:TM7S3/TM198-like domain-containing protein n=1 Tax=Emergomyces africanus TaxID=1955775 RepID=A0A1B7P030_9EURO|nr:hypothetical protein ACJ72_03254 [Emergomyces africanus]